MADESKSALPFAIEPNEKYTLIKVAGRPQGDSSKIFDRDIAPYLQQSPVKPILINCEYLEDLSSFWMRSLAHLAQSLKSSQSAIRLFGVRPEIKKILKDAALHNTIPVKDSLREALVELRLTSIPRIDVNFINPFLVATLRVLEIQAQVKATPGQVFKRQPQDRFAGDISGVIGLVSDAFTGTVILSFPEKTFLSVMSNMLGEPCTTLSKEIADGVGELTNIIFGQAKVALNDLGFGIRTAIPTIVIGNQHEIQHQTLGPRVAIPFESNAGSFTVEICLSE